MLHKFLEASRGTGAHVEEGWIPIRRERYSGVEASSATPMPPVFGGKCGSKNGNEKCLNGTRVLTLG